MLAILQPVRSPQWSVSYNGIDITADLAGITLSVSYTDYLSELSSELEIVAEDRNHKWQSSWYPTFGDQLNLVIGYKGQGLLPCGDFQIDQVELTGPPDTFTIRCLAAFITTGMRTRNSLGYEGLSLLQIAQTIGNKYGLTVVSAPEVIDIVFDRVTQKNETDLAFLKRLAVEHGYDFTVRASVLVFYSRTVLEATPPIRTVTRSDLESFEFRNRTTSTYGSAQVSYGDPFAKSLITQSALASEPVAVSDVLKEVSRCEDGQQALLRAQAALGLRNRVFIEGTLSMPGSVAMVSGNAIEMSGFGRFDGPYIISQARHRIDRAQGYTTRLEVIRVF